MHDGKDERTAEEIIHEAEQRAAARPRPEHRSNTWDTINRQLEAKPITQAIPGHIQIGCDVLMVEGAFPQSHHIEMIQLDGGGARYVMHIFVGK